MSMCIIYCGANGTDLYYADLTGFCETVVFGTAALGFNITTEYMSQQGINCVCSFVVQLKHSRGLIHGICVQASVVLVYYCLPLKRAGFLLHYYYCMFSNAGDRWTEIL